MKMWIISMRLFLSALLIVSTGGFATYAHFCKDNLVSASLFIPVDPCSSGSCSMPQGDESPDCCQHESQDTEINEHCCDDDFLFLQTTPVKDEEAPELHAVEAQNSTYNPYIAHYSEVEITYEADILTAQRLFLRYQNFRL